jgi:hypothetical protein
MDNSKEPQGEYRKAEIVYAVMAALTLFFQIYIRSSQCVTDCVSSYFKAVAWSLIWPVSWIVYLAGLLP